MSSKHPRWMAIRCCPYCRSFDVRRSHRRGFLEVMILPLCLMRPFRCEECGVRHFNYVWLGDLPSYAVAPKERSE